MCPQVLTTMDTMSSEWQTKNPINCSPLMQVGGGGRQAGKGRASRTDSGRLRGATRDQAVQHCT